MIRDQNRDERGFTLLLTVLTLLLVTSLGFAALNVVQTDQQVAGYLNRKRMALNAADAGVSRALETLQSNGTPTVPTTALGDGGAFPHGQPTYGVDTTAADPVENLGIGGLSGMNLRVGQNGSVQFQVQYWRIRVQGEAPGGTVSRVEFVAGNLVAN